LAGVLLVILPTVMIGGVSILTLLIGDSAYMRNPLRQDLWRAGHAHAGVLLILSLIVLRYVDEAQLTSRLKAFVRVATRRPRFSCHSPSSCLCLHRMPRNQMR